MALCTLTVIVQVPVARAAVVKLIVPAPAVAVTVPPPTLQPLTTTGVVATTKFAGKISVKLELIVVEFPFVIPNVTVLGVFTETVVGLKLLAIEGGCKMVMVAVTVCWSTVASAEPVPPMAPALNVAVACAPALSASG